MVVSISIGYLWPVLGLQELPRFVYLHYPICRHHCSYCDFNVVSQLNAGGDFDQKWLQSLSRHLESFQTPSETKPVLETLYLGGGTPSLLSIASFNELKVIFSRFYRFSNETEITVECNPETLTEDYLIALKNWGVNRISLGVQSHLPEHLRRLERLATHEAITDSIEWISKYFLNYSLDFMIGIPDQGLQSLEKDLDLIARIRPPHLSIYLLTLALDHKWKVHPAMNFRLAKSELAAQMYARVCERLRDLGYDHYEVSNFAQPSFRSRHNSNYWNVKSDYLALGPGAHGYLKHQKGRMRYEMHKDLKTWISDPTGISSSEFLDAEQQRLEEVYLALRTRKPLSIDRLKSVNLSRLEAEGLVSTASNEVVLTETGWLLMESIAAELMC